MTIKFEAVPFHDQTEADKALAGRIAEVLTKHYPGHPWAVFVDSDGGVVVIRSLAVSFKWGYVLKLSRVSHDPDLNAVIRAGGEILERAGMPRAWWDGKTAEHVEGLPDKDQPFCGVIL